MTYYSSYYILSPYDIEHHGILGMKWGVRRYQNKDGTLTPEGRKRYLKGDKKRSNKEDTYSGILENMVISLAVNTALNTGRQLVTKFRKSMDESSARDNVHGPEDLPKKKKMGSVEEDLRNVNPNFIPNDQKDNGYIRNCQYCSAVYDLRRRGYDVSARQCIDGGTIRSYLSWYKGAIADQFRDKESAAEWIKSQPDGSRGQLSATGKYGGHSVAYEIHRGKIELLDGQVNRPWDWDRFTTWFPRNYQFVRTDNLEPNWDTIGEVIDPESLRKGR